MNNKLADNIN